MAANDSPAANAKLVGGDLCLDFANTVSYRQADRNTGDKLGSYYDLLLWSEHAGLLSHRYAQHLARLSEARPADAARAFQYAIDLREIIYRIFAAVAANVPVADMDLSVLNRYVVQAMTQARIMRTDQGLEWGWVDDSQALERMVWPIARSAADLLTSGRVERVRQCDGEDCTWLFVDTSKNHSRRWCDMEDCGNRAKARRHYARVHQAA